VSRSKTTAITAMVLVALAAIIYVLFQGDDADAVPTASQVEERSMSPFCPGLTIAECPHGQSIALRREIADKVQKGWTNAEIDDWLVANYGESILGSPRDPLTRIAPVVLLIAGLGAVLAIGRGRAPTVEPAGLTAGEQQTIEADLADFREDYSE